MVGTGLARDVNVKIGQANILYIDAIMEYQMSGQKPNTTFMSFCPTCGKLFTRENAFNRHVSYCRRAQTSRKGRPKSCLACNSSKSKCSFTTPQCTRCGKKGLDCIYATAQIVFPPPAFEPADQNMRQYRQVTAQERQQSSMLIHDHWMQDVSTEDIFPQLINTGPDVNTSTPGSFGNSMSGGVAGWAASTAGTHFCDARCTLFHQPTLPVPPLSPKTNLILRSRATRPLTPLPHNTIATRHAARLISRIIGAFPRMMLRRNTFPPFIHPQWHLDAMPETLATCMSISQMFMSRTQVSRAFLWRTIEAECQHLYNERFKFPKNELQQATQAVTIYIIMAVVDQDINTPARGARLMQTCLALKQQLHIVLEDASIMQETESLSPSAIWEDWIFAESRRRMSCLWFAIIRVFSFNTGSGTCSNLDNIRCLPLSSTKTLWEARSSEEWEVEKTFDYSGYPLQTFGELFEAHKQSEPTIDPQRLDSWQAGADKLGVMMDSAIELAEFCG